MTKKTVLHFFAALICCLAIGFGIIGVVYVFDTYFDMPAPLEGGQTIDFSAYGFTLTVPDGYALNDYTTNHIAEGGNALFAGCAYGGGQELYIYCHENAQRDSLSDYEEQELVRHYMSAGAEETRLRTLGGRPFICYRAEVFIDNETQIWDTYETWDPQHHIVFETRMNPWDVLPILQTITFTAY